MNGHARGAALRCDQDRVIVSVEHDSLGLFHPGQSLDSVLEAMSFRKFLGFLDEVRSSGAAYQWEVNVQDTSGSATLLVSGVMRPDGAFLVFSAPPDGVFAMYDQLFSIVNDQSAQLREMGRQKRKSSRQANEDLLEALDVAGRQLSDTRRELQRAHEEIAQHVSRFWKLVNENGDGIIILDMDNRPLFANPAAEALLGVGLPELQARPLDLGAGWREMREVSVTGQGECTRWLEPRFSDIVWRDRPACLVTLRDVTQRKQMEQMREDMERISRHDLRTPLGAMIYLPDILLEDFELPEDARRLVELIRVSGHRMLHQINMSLDLARMETGTYQVVAAPLDLSLLLERVSADLDKTAREGSVEIRITTRASSPEETEPVFAFGEESLCYTLFSNLLTNAVEASPPGATVTVVLRRGPQAVVDIHNEGAIPPEIQPVFFEKYATHGKKGGTGLGTYSARLLARIQKGEVSFSTSAETGTTLRVALPLAACGRTRPCPQTPGQ